MSSISAIEKLPEIIHRGRKEAKDVLNRSNNKTFTYKEKIIPDSNYRNNSPNEFYQGDNLLVIEKLLKEGYRGKIDLIYIDPPFLTKVRHNGKITLNDGNKNHVIEFFAYDDVWEGGLFSYLEMLYPRLYLMRELLSERGSIYVHLDYRTVHYVKILLDSIFGEENFLNEIIWAYKSGGVSKRYYSRKHDTILVYTKGKDYIFNPQLEKSYNRDFKPYRFRGVKEYKDEVGWYTMVNLKDVWQIDMVGRTSKERVNYATQKPEKLLERIILTSSNENSIVADFFAGSGTMGIVAEKLNRKWIMADKGDLSAVTIYKRLIENSLFPFYSYKESFKANDGGKLELKNIKINDNMLDIELGSYSIDMEKINIKDKYKPIIQEILNNMSLSLLDFIGIDLDYDDKFPKIGMSLSRNSNKPIIEHYINVPGSFKDSQKIYIKYIDIFGKENFDIYKIINGRLVKCQEYWKD